MEKFYSTTGLLLLATVFILVIRKHNGEIAMVLSLLTCCIALCVSIHFLSPVIQFVRKLRAMASIDSEMLQILLKITAVAYTAQIASTVCADAGSSSLAKSLQILSTVVIVYLSIPMMEALLSLLERILVGL